VIRLAQRTATIAPAVAVVLANPLGAEPEALHVLCNGRVYSRDAVQCVGCGMEPTEEIGEASVFKVHCLKAMAATAIGTKEIPSSGMDGAVGESGGCDAYLLVNTTRAGYVYPVLLNLPTALLERHMASCKCVTAR